MTYTTKILYATTARLPENVGQLNAIAARITKEETVKRYAAVTGARDAREVAAYLPDNYKLASEETCSNCDGKGHNTTWPHTTCPVCEGEFIIEGEDVAGWTLDGYVIPRLASGTIVAREQYLWVEDDGDGESGPRVSTWLEDEPQTREAMARRDAEQGQYGGEVEGNEDGSNRDVPPFDNDPRSDAQIKQEVYDRFRRGEQDDDYGDDDR